MVKVTKSDPKPNVIIEMDWETAQRLRDTLGKANTSYTVYDALKSAGVTPAGE